MEAGSEKLEAGIKTLKTEAGSRVGWAQHHRAHQWEAVLPASALNMSTIRQEIIALLSGGRFRAKDISKIVRISEKEVYVHLEHINRSLKPRAMKVSITPALCLACGFTFEARNRFSSPGRCPKCKGEHIQDPEYGIGDPGR